LLIQGMFTEPTEAIGRQAKFDLDQGIPLTSGMLVDSADQLSSTGSVAALNVPRGMVAVSIPISRLSSVSYAPQSGDHVNVIVTLIMVDLDSDFQTSLPNDTATILAPGPTSPEGGPSAVTAHYMVEPAEGAKQGKGYIDPVLGQTLYVIPSGQQRPRMVSQTLLQDVVVLHMGTFPVKSANATSITNVAGETQAVPAEGEAPQTTSPSGEEVPVTAPELPDVVTLVVTPQDAVTLNYLIYSGAQMTLALRATGDNSRAEIEAVTLQFLLDSYNIPVPVKLPYGLEPPVNQLVEPSLRNDNLPTPTR
jgi:pilus assembly protein CpaB